MELEQLASTFGGKPNVKCMVTFQYGDVYPRGDCIDSQKCEKDNRIFKLVSVKSLKSCLEDEWCKPNKLGIYECAKKPGNYFKICILYIARYSCIIRKQLIN